MRVVSFSPLPLPSAKMSTETAAVAATEKPKKTSTKKKVVVQRKKKINRFNRKPDEVKLSEKSIAKKEINRKAKATKRAALLKAAKEAKANKKHRLRPSRKTAKTLEYTINIHKAVFGVQFKKRAPRAIKTIQQFASKMMKTKDVRIDAKLNKFIWSQGIRNVPRRVRVRIARKKNEDEDSREKMYSLVTYVEVPTFSQLGTKKIE